MVIPRKAVQAIPVVFVLLVLIVAGILWLKRGDADTRALRAMVRLGIEAIETKNATACLSFIHPTYTDSLGNDYASIEREARRNFGYVSDIRVKIRNLEIEAERGVGTVAFDMRLTAKVDDGMGGRVPVSGVTNTRGPLGAPWEGIALRCIKREGMWQVTQLTIREAGP
ncbi:MAG TPA: hypothetical protein PLO37_20430 [Candidatus Hydrogenedentes bacterium]|nr:hypothetical protein [Candidatus Hydrogenedentota bacterium]HPG69222.1 hypothetical protein [Candidatus Hydrogenedentota bacterium]